MKQSLEDLYSLYSLLNNNTRIVTDAIISLANHQQSRDRVYKKVSLLNHEALHPYVMQLLDMKATTLISFAKDKKYKESFNQYIVNIKEEYKEVFNANSNPKFTAKDDLYYADGKEITKELYNHVMKYKQKELI